MDDVGSLAQLERAQLVQRTDDVELSYLFKHALTQDSAYQTLLLKTRRNLHRSVAVAYEQFYPEQLEELAGLLAHHYSAGGEDDKAFAYAVRAGDGAARRSANIEARTYYDQALAALSRLPDTTENRRRRVDAMLKRVAVALRSEGPERSLERMLEAEALAHTLDASGDEAGDRGRMARIHYWIGQTFLHSNRLTPAIRYLQEVLAFGESEGGGLEFVAVPSCMIGRAWVSLGYLDRAEPLLTRAVRLLEQVPNLHEQTLAGAFLGLTLAGRGNYRAGLLRAQQTRDRALESNHFGAIALSYLGLAVVYMSSGESESMLQAGHQMIEAANRTGDRLVAYLGHAFFGWAQSRLGNHAAAQESLAQSQELARALGAHLIFDDWLAAARAEAAFNAGELAQAEELAAAAVSYALSTDNIFAQAMAHRVWGQALTARGAAHLADAGEHLATALQLFETGDARLEAAHTHIAWGTLCQAQGDADAARAHWGQAREQFEASGLRM
ncbi:MAG: hypothetical protein WCF84_12115 [Anaerolineae bacterium]